MMKIVITNTQYSALMDIYGPPKNIHHMIMTCKFQDGKVVLEGDEDDFDDLLGLISEEIGEKMCPKKNINSLLCVCKKVDPGSMDWIGM